MVTIIIDTYMTLNRDWKQCYAPTVPVHLHLIDTRCVLFATALNSMTYCRSLL